MTANTGIQHRGGHHQQLQHRPDRDAPAPALHERRGEHDHGQPDEHRRPRAAEPGTTSGPAPGARSRTTSASKHRFAGQGAAGGTVGARRAFGDLLRGRPVVRGRRVRRSVMPSSTRASPAVTTEPVTSTPAPDSTSVGGVLGQPDRGLEASSSRGSTVTRSVSKHLHGGGGELVGGQRAAGGVLRDDELVDDRLQRGEQAGDVLVGQDAEHDDEPAEVERLLQRGTLWPACRPGCARRRAARSAPSAPPPAGPASAPRRTRRARCRCRACRCSRRRRRTPRPRRARTRRSAPGGRRAAAGRARRRPRRGPAAVSACPPTATARSRTPNSRPSRATVACTSVARASSAAAASGGWAARIAVAPGLMMPAFSVAICPTVSPRNFWWSSATGVTTATSASRTLVASHSPPRPTSTTADVDRGVGEDRVGQRRHHLEERQLDVEAGVDQVEVGRQLVVGVDEASGRVIGAPSSTMRSVIRSTGADWCSDRCAARSRAAARRSSARSIVLPLVPVRCTAR